MTCCICRSGQDVPKLPRVHTLPGLCSYGRSTHCCFGWRNINGICHRKSAICYNPIHLIILKHSDVCVIDILRSSSPCWDMALSSIWFAFIFSLLCSTAVCKNPCVNGKCVGPDKCLCSTGYKGRQCNEGEVQPTKMIVRFTLLISSPLRVLAGIV